MAGNGKLSNSSKKVGQQNEAGSSGDDIAYLNEYNSTYHGWNGNDVIYGSSRSIMTVDDTSTTPVESIYGDNGNDWINAGGGYKDVYVYDQSLNSGNGGYYFDHHLADYMDGGAGPDGSNSGSDWVSFQPFGAPNGSGQVCYSDPYQYGVVIVLDEGVSLIDGIGNYAFGTVDSGSGGFFGFFGGSGSDYAVGTAVNFENVWGSNASDWIIGSDSNNNLKGANGLDWIEGLDGNDEISGGAGDDLLAGDFGGYYGYMSSGGYFSSGGSDTFKFESSYSENGSDYIADFETSRDVLDLSAAIKVATLDNIDDYLALIDDDGGALLWVDTDGAGSADSSNVWAGLEYLSTGDTASVIIQLAGVKTTISLTVFEPV